MMRMMMIKKVVMCMVHIMERYSKSMNLKMCKKCFIVHRAEEEFIAQYQSIPYGFRIYVETRLINIKRPFLNMTHGTWDIKNV